MSSLVCDICGNTEQNRIVTAREMMFGMRSLFDYLECADCGCVQLVDVPPDLSQYYPADYYSLGQPALPPAARPLIAAIKQGRAEALLRMPVGVVNMFVKARCAPPQFAQLAGLGLTTSSAICDLGSGTGQGLAWMLRQGFSRLTGLDPYISQDHRLGERLAIRRQGIEDMQGGWDLIMLNHAFEHMPQPLQVLRRLRQRLSRQGAIIVRVPVADSWAWRTYRADWVQLDAPRHLHIPTGRSMRILAEASGLKVTRVFYDSNALQFWGSEQYRHDIPLRSPRSYAENTQSDLFTASQIQEFERRSRELNRKRLGDSAGFVLRTAQ
jgi:hypothetical protein